MSTERLITKSASSEMCPAASQSFRCGAEPVRIFDELPVAAILSVSQPDASNISPLLLSYTIEMHYKQFNWRLIKKASQVIYLHFALKKRAIIEEIHEKQEQVKDWLQYIGIGDQTSVKHDDDEPDDGAVPVYNEDTTKKRYVPSSAALPIIRPSLGRQQAVSERAKVAMQGYLNHFLGDIDIVNSREVCKFLEVSMLSFSQEYGPKLKEDYVLVKHLRNVPRDEADTGCFLCCWPGCCRGSWQKVWAVLKPGFLALLKDPFDTKPLDIIIFDVLPSSSGLKVDPVNLANKLKERNPLRYAFNVTCGNRSTMLRTTSSAKIKDWVSSINEVGFRPPDGWSCPRRFGSFAPERGLNEDGSQAQWFVDGQVAFDAIASAIESAKSEIYITGWWLCPELYLRRPFYNHASSRLDALFEAKAKQGVQIYILLYKEVAIALKINSSYSQKRLLNIHDNVKVLRHPDHFSTGVYLWSHHEKIVVVDHQVCFIGGLDLCFGRYDTTEHKLGDCPPFLWPGKDYYNPRETEPNSWEDAMKDELERGRFPRMPWHDVHCALWGPPCRDIARHFVQRWNHAKRNRAPNEQAVPLLIPQLHMVLPHYMGRSREMDITSTNDELKHGNIIGEDSFSYESPSQDIPLLLPHEAEGQVPSHERSASTVLDSDQHHFDPPERESHGLSFSFQKSLVEDLIPDMRTTTFADNLCSLEHPNKVAETLSNSDSQFSDEWWGTRIFGEVKEAGPRCSCRCQVIRSVSQWSAGTSQTEDSIHKAYCSLIDNAEHFVYIENQFFISGLSGDDTIQNRVLEAVYRRILRAHKEEKRFRVIVVLPLLPGFQGGLDDSGAATVRAIMHWQYRTISRGKNSILYNLNAVLGPKMDDYITFCGLRNYGRLRQGGPLVTSQVYVHSKVMIVDDRIALVGSSNINDRSLLGSRDSEIGVLIEDNDFFDSTMDEVPFRAGKFACSLRLSLWLEHLGLHAREICRIKDPVSDSTYKDLWLSNAKENSMIYQEVFSCIPNETMHSRSALRQSMAYWKEKLSHTTIDLGIAPDKIELRKDGEISNVDPEARLKSVRGFLVSFPLDFMCQEDLRPMFSEGEFYASPQVFY